MLIGIKDGWHDVVAATEQQWFRHRLPFRTPRERYVFPPHSVDLLAASALRSRQNCDARRAAQRIGVSPEKYLRRVIRQRAKFLFYY
jgi:hypothetical protein